MTTYPQTITKGSYLVTTDTTPPLDTRPVTVPLWALDRFLSHVAADGWTRADKPELGQAWDELIAAKDAALGHEMAAPVPKPAPPLPRDGEYLHVQVKGYQEYEGWVSEGTFCGSPYVFIHDHDGRLIAKFPPDSVHCMTPPPFALRTPGPVAAITAGECDCQQEPLPAGAREGYYPEGYFDGVPQPGGEDDGPADAFPGRPAVDPEADF